MKFFTPVFFIILLFGCSDKEIVDDPVIILPVYKQALQCCDGYKCAGHYENIYKEESCKDVQEIESCLNGNKEYCPIKGYGAF